MVSKRSKTTTAATGKQGRPPLAVALPHELVVDIVGLVAATSAQPIADLTSIRATSKAMYAASKERHVGRLVALKKEGEAGAMKWRENARYHAVLERLAAAGNPEACFLAGVALVFGSKQQRPASDGLVLLEQAAVAGHKAAAYVLGLLLHTVDGMRDVAERYIGQVEGDAVGCESDETAKRTNRECKRWRRLVAGVVQEVTWKKKPGPPGRVPVTAPEDGSKRCTGKGCGVPADGWAEYDVLCSDGCRIKHEYTQFFTEVFNYLP